jgi:arylsulfatase A-like enzyme
MRFCLVACSLWLLLAITVPCAVAAEQSPNIVLVLCDNLGYGDLGCYGSKLHRTPAVDRLAAEGMRFTDCYAASGVCSPSRAAMWSGCYPRRVGMQGSDSGGRVLQPVSTMGLHPDEITIAEVLKAQGYATALMGKWHLGDQLPLLPTRQGFDYYLGIPYSDDMTAREGKPWPPLPLLQNEKVIDAPVDRNLLTKRYTEAVVEFIEQHRQQPFFVCLAHAMPGSTKTPYASEAFQGRSANGPWGDAVEEIDWSTAQIMAALERLGLDENTLVIWTNDNGAPRRNPPQGLNLPLTGWGYDTSEGAMRVPMIARWPGKIPAGATCRELCSLIDLLPTFAHLAGTAPSADRVIDGRNVWPLLAGESNARSPHEAFYYYFGDQLQAVRSGPYKLYLPLEKPAGPSAQQKPTAARLYDLTSDLQEMRNLASDKPEVVARLIAFAERARRELGDNDQPGTGQRPAAKIANPTPRVMETTTAR